MQPVPGELDAVRLILSRRQAGDSFRRIAQDLTAAGHRTKRGGKWHPATVRDVWEARKRYGKVLADASAA